LFFERFFKSPGSLFVEPSAYGLKLDGRFGRSGGTGQPGGSFVSTYEIREHGTTTVTDDYLGPVVAQQYLITFDSYLAQSMLEKIEARHMAEGLRLDATASWKRSLTERMRQNRKMVNFIDTPGPVADVLIGARKIFEDLRDTMFREFYQTLASHLLDHGDWSERAFIHYALEHSHSSMGGLKWSSFIKGEPAELTEIGRKIYQMLKSGARKLLAILLNDSSYGERGLFATHSLNPAAMFAALRSRPAELSGFQPTSNELSPEAKAAEFADYALSAILSGSMLVEKYRDRNAGGAFVISHLGFVLDDETKKLLYQKLHALLRRFLGKAVPTYFPEEHGKEAFLKLKNDLEWILFDTGNAEKLEGYVCDLPFRVNLSEPGLAKWVGRTKLSGTIDTRFGGDMAESIIARSAMELGYLDFKVALGGGDNWAIKGYLSPEIHDIFSPAGRWLGHTPQGDQGFKLVRDGAKTNSGLKKLSYDYVANRVPASSLARTLIGLGLTEVTYWDLFEAIPMEVKHFEAGSPTSGDMWDKLNLEGNSVRSLLYKALEDVNVKRDLADKVTVFNDLKQGGSYEYELKQA
jgi:hypothetical protein